VQMRWKLKEWRMPGFQLTNQGWNRTTDTRIFNPTEGPALIQDWTLSPIEP